MSYPTLEDAKVAGLFHPNCGCSMLLYIPGVTKLEPVPEGREEADDRQYKAQQKQRYYERQLRRWKRREAVAETDDERIRARSHINNTYKLLRQHVEDNGLSRARAREGIGKTRYGNNPKLYSGADKYIAERAVKAYERYTDTIIPAKEKAAFLELFLPRMAGVRDYTIIRKEVFKMLGGGK